MVRPQQNGEENGIVVSRGAAWDDYHDLNTGVHKKVYYGGIVNFENKLGEYEPINRTVDNVGCDVNFDYCVDKNLYQVHFKNTPNTAQSVKFVAENHNFFFQPFTLNYRNDLDQLQQINTIQSVSVVVDDNQFYYPDAFGSGINLSYEYWNRVLKENLILENKAVLPPPKQYVLDGGNPSLDLDFLISFDSEVDVYVNGELWDKKNTKTTIERVDFKVDGDTLFFLPKPYAHDNTGKSSELTYEFKKQGNKLYTTLKTNYSWLNNTAVFPVRIDPTTTYNYSAETNIYAYECEDDDDQTLPPADEPHPTCVDTWTDITSDSDLDSDDATAESTGAGLQDQSYHVFEVDVQESASSITKINWTWDGAETVSGTLGVYHFNHTKDGWSSACGTTTGSATIRCVETANPSDFINSSDYAHMIAHAVWAGFTSKMETDFVKLEVTYSLNYNLSITDPTTGDPESVSAGDDVTITFDFQENAANLSSDVVVDNITVGGVLSNISSNYQCTGTPSACTGLGTEGNCTQGNCTWGSASCSGSGTCSATGNSGCCTEGGCSWFGACIGSVTCSNYDDQTCCEDVNCDWNPASCSGNNPYSCNTYLSQGNCTAHGCNWGQQWYTTGTGWQVNVTMPSGLTGTQDLFVNATYSGNTANDTEPDSLDFGTADTCSCPSPAANWVMDCDDSCNITSNCNIHGFNLSLVGSSGNPHLLANVSMDYLILEKPACPLVVKKGVGWELHIKK